METNARYLTIGCFALAAIVACLGFVFWLNRTGGLGQQDVYQVRFGNQVSGLQTGGAVLFNGMRVGSVASLLLDPQDPRHVLATLTVAKGTPVRRDTVIGIASQGLMGTVAVSLEGGNATALPVATDGGPVPMLSADPSAGRSLTQTAQETLQHVDAILGENSAAVKSTLDNVKVFSDALARNADRVDAVMAGLAQLAGGGPAKPAPPVYDIAAPRLTGLPSTVLPGQIVIAEPTAVVALQTQRLLTRSPEGQLTPSGDMQWSDALPKLLQVKILQSFQDSGLATTLTPPATFGKDDRQLQIDLRRFDIAAGPDPRAEVAFAATILSGEGRVLATRVFAAQSSSSATDEPASIKALGAALGTTVNELGVWIAHPVTPPPANL